MSERNPTLKHLQGRIGVDYYGNFNTGTAPTIQRYDARPFSAKLGANYFMVGAQLDLEIVRKRIFNAVAFTNSDKSILNKRKVDVDSRTVYLFQTSAPAWKKFHELNDAAIKRNAKIRAEVAEAKKAVAKGDLSKLHVLSDNGAY